MMELDTKLQLLTTGGSHLEISRFIMERYRLYSEPKEQQINENLKPTEVLN
jgi:hypothetical protein